MTDKLLSIKLSVDTTDGAKFASITKEMASSVETVTTATVNLTEKEQERLTLLEKQENAYIKLQNTIINANNSLAEGSRGSNLAWGNAERSLAAYNKVIDQTKDKLIALNAEHQRTSNLASAAAAGASIMAGGKSTGTGLSSGTLTGSEAAVQARLAREETLRQNFNAATAAMDAHGAEQREFIAQAEANRRIVMYGNMARTIEERAAAHNAAMARTEAASGFSRLSESARFDPNTINQIQMTQRLTEFTRAEAAARQANTSTVTEHTTATNTNSAAVSSNVVHHQNLLLRIAEVMGAYKLLNITLQYTKQALLDVPKAGLEQQVTESSLLGIFGSAKTQENLAFIQDVAKEAGQSLVILEQAYRRYAPSAVLAGTNQAAVNKSFKEFAEVGTILHLPEEKINSLFLALDQMFAKGVVQSEEVKKQLGNVLPGAVETFAKSMGKTPAEFMQAMKANEVIAKDAVPIFAEYYRKIFGGPDDSVFNLTKDRLQSNLYRLQSSYTLMDRAIFADTKETMNQIVKESANMVDAITTNIKGIIQAVELLSTVIMTRLVGVAIVSTITGFTSLTSVLNRTLIALTGLAAPELAFAAAATVVIGKLAGLGLAYDKTTGFLVTYKDKSVDLVNFLQSIPEAVTDIGSNMFSAVKANLDGLVVSSNLLSEALAGIKNTLKEIEEQKSGEKGFDILKKITPDKGSSAVIDRTVILAQIKDQRDLINSFEDTRKSALDVQKAIAEGKLQGATPAETNKNITEALSKLIIIPEAERAGGGGDLEPPGISTGATSRALAKQQALLTQSNDAIKQSGDIKIALLEKQKAAIEQSMVAVNGKVATPELQGRQQVQDIELKILSIKREVTRATELATLAAQKENAILESNALLLTKNKEAIYNAVRWQETKVKSDTDESTGISGRFGGRGASAVGGSEADKSRGSMQVTEKAWKDTGREAKDFATANMIELSKAGRQYLDQMIARFKDLELSLAAYNQGTGAVTDIYKKAGVKVGETDPEELAKVKANLTPLMLKYVKETMSTIPVQKGDISAITQQTVLNKLKADEAIQDIQIQQKKDKANQDNIVYLSQYKAKVQELQAQALLVQGQTEAGEKLKLDLKFQQQRAEYANNDEALKYIDIIEKSAISTTLVTKAEQHLKDVTAEINALENNINIERQAGLMTQANASTELTKAKQKLITAETTVVDVLKQQIAAGINIKDNEQRLLALTESRNQQLLKSTQLQQSVISGGDKFGLASSTQKHLSDQANIKANASADIDNVLGGADPLKATKDQQDKILKIKSDANKAELSSNLQMYAGIAEMGSQTFGMLTSEMIKMYGARSTQARAAFAMEKAFNISAVIMNTATSIMKALDVEAPMGEVLAGMYAAMGAVQLATVMSQPMPQAHAGLTNVPADQTYLLSAGERVLAPQQNKDLTKALSDGTMGGNKQQQQPHTTKIINVFDPSIVGQYMNTPQGETLIMNTVRRNQAA